MRTRRTRSSILAILSAAFALALLMSACGTDSDDDDTAATSEETEDEEAAADGDAEEQPDEWVIGWINPLSGGAATFGDISRNAIDLAVEEINDAGGINGVPLRVVYEDNELAPEPSVVAAERLAGQDIKLIISAGSSVVFALDPIASQRDLLIANHAAQSPQLLPPGTQRTFNFIPTSSAEVERLAERAVNDEGLETIGIIHVDNDYGQDTTDAFVEFYEQEGGTVVAREVHDLGASDMRTQLIQIRDANPDAVLFVSNVTEVGHAVAQARELGIDAQYLGLTFSLSPDNFEIAGDAMEGMKGVAITFRPEDNPQAEAFMDAYTERYDGEPTIYAATSYDAIGILAHAIGETGSDEWSAISEYLVGLDGYEGVLGTTSIDDTRTVSIPFFEWEIVDGEPVAWE